MRLVSCLFCLLGLANVVLAAETLADLADGGEVRIVEVVDGDTVRLADGAQVRLVGIQAPKLPLGRPGFPTWPLAGASKRFLEDLTLGREARMRFGGRRLGRHGRWLAHLVTEADGWIQQKILTAGMARAVSPGLHRRAELGREITQAGLQTVARYPQTLDPAIGRRVRLGMTDDHGRRIGRRVIRRDRIQQRRRHLGLAAVHVRPGARAANVDPAIQWVSHGRTMAHSRVPLQRTMVRWGDDYGAAWIAHASAMYRSAESR